MGAMAPPLSDILVLRNKINEEKKTEKRASMKWVKSDEFFEKVGLLGSRDLRSWERGLVNIKWVKSDEFFFREKKKDYLGASRSGKMGPPTGGASWVLIAPPLEIF